MMYMYDQLYELELVENALKDYVNNLPTPCLTWPKSEFKKASYRMWIAKDILNTWYDYVGTYSEDDILNAIYHKMNTMNKIIMNTTSQDTRMCFEAAYETLVDISHIFYDYPTDG